MLGLAYRDELREKAKMPQELAATDDDPGAFLTYGITFPTLKVFLYALTQEPVFLKEQLEFLDDLVPKNVLPPYYSTRLKIRELFECLKLLDPECLWIVLERLKSHHTSAIEDLKNAVLQNNDIGEFELVLDKYKINTDPITPISKLVFIQIRIDRLLEKLHKAPEIFNIMDDEKITDEQKEWLLQTISGLSGILEDLQLHQSSDNVGRNFIETFERTLLDDGVTVSVMDDYFSDEALSKNHAKSIKKEHPEFDEKGFTFDEFLNYKYRTTLLSYCVFVQEFSCLSTFAKLEMEKLLRNKHFESIWSEFVEFDNNAIEILKKGINEFSKKYSLLVCGVDEAEEDKGIQPAPQIEEPQTVEQQPPAPTPTPTPEPNQETITVDPDLTDRDYETFAYPLLQGRKKGRHRGKWYNTKYYDAAEDELGDSIKRDVWPLIRNRLGEFEYPDSVAGESKRTVVKNLGAALIYYAAQGTNPPIAKDWNDQGVKSSYERTFERIEKVAKNSVDAFMTMLKQYEEVEPLLESDQKNKAVSKLLVLLKSYGNEQKKFILSHNLYEIKDLIEYLRRRLPEIFKPYYRDK